jgi:hypothetical protein
MSTQSLSAILLIAGPASMLASFLIGLPGVYKLSDLQQRVQLIEDNMARWNMSQIAIGLGAVLMASGFSLLAAHLRQSNNGWGPLLGAGILLAGTISGLFFLFRQTTDPLSAYQGNYKTFEYLYYWLAVAGLLLFGIAFLQSGLPAWLGYVTAGTTAVYAIYFMISGVGYPTPGLVTILALVTGIVLLRQ